LVVSFCRFGSQPKKGFRCQGPEVQGSGFRVQRLKSSSLAVNRVKTSTLSGEP
jgi:hypothetical protein